MLTKKCILVIVLISIAATRKLDQLARESKEWGEDLCQGVQAAYWDPQNTAYLPPSRQQLYQLPIHLKTQQNDPTTKNLPDEFRGKQFIAEFSGYLDVLDEGTYEFYVDGADGAVMFVSQVENSLSSPLFPVASLKPFGVSMYNLPSMYLSSGLHRFLLLQYSLGGNSGVSLNWAKFTGDGKFSRQDIPMAIFKTECSFKVIPLDLLGEQMILQGTQDRFLSSHTPPLNTLQPPSPPTTNKNQQIFDEYSEDLEEVFKIDSPLDTPIPNPPQNEQYENPRLDHQLLHNIEHSIGILKELDLYSAKDGAEIFGKEVPANISSQKINLGRDLDLSAAINQMQDDKLFLDSAGGDASSLMQNIIFIDYVIQNEEKIVQESLTSAEIVEEIKKVENVQQSSSVGIIDRILKNETIFEEIEAAEKFVENETGYDEFEVFDDEFQNAGSVVFKKDENKTISDEFQSIYDEIQTIESLILDNEINNDEDEEIFGEIEIIQNKLQNEKNLSSTQIFDTSLEVVEEILDNNARGAHNVHDVHVTSQEIKDKQASFKEHAKKVVNDYDETYYAYAAYSTYDYKQEYLEYVFDDFIELLELHLQHVIYKEKTQNQKLAGSFFADLLWYVMHHSGHEIWNADLHQVDPFELLKFNFTDFLTFLKLYFSHMLVADAQHAQYAYNVYGAYDFDGMYNQNGNTGQYYKYDDYVIYPLQEEHEDVFDTKEMFAGLTLEEMQLMCDMFIMHAPHTEESEGHVGDLMRLVRVGAVEVFPTFVEMAEKNLMYENDNEYVYDVYNVHGGYGMYEIDVQNVGYGGYGMYETGVQNAGSGQYASAGYMESKERAKSLDLDAGHDDIHARHLHGAPPTPVEDPASIPDFDTNEAYVPYATYGTYVPYAIYDAIPPKASTHDFTTYGAYHAYGTYAHHATSLKPSMHTFGSYGAYGVYAVYDVTPPEAASHDVTTYGAYAVTPFRISTYGAYSTYAVDVTLSKASVPDVASYGAYSTYAVDVTLSKVSVPDVASYGAYGTYSTYSHDVTSPISSIHDFAGYGAYAVYGAYL